MIQEEFQDLEGTVLPGYCGLKAIGAHGSQQWLWSAGGGSRIPKREQLPNDNYRANATFKVYLKSLPRPARGPQLVVSRADGLVVYLFATKCQKLRMRSSGLLQAEANPPSRFVGPRTKIAVDTLDRDRSVEVGARGSRIQVVVNELM